MTMPRPSHQVIGVTLVLTAALLWSTSGLFIKVLTMPPLTLVGWRAFFAACALAPLVRWGSIRLDRRLLVLTAAYASTMIGFVVATRWTTAANAITLQSAAPAWVFLYTCLLTRRLVLPLLWPVGLILFGLAVLMSEPGQGTSLAGNLIATGTGVTFAALHLSFARIGQPPAGALFVSNLVTALLGLAFSPAPLPDWEGGWPWLALVYLGTFQVALAMWLFSRSLQFIPVSQASVLSLLEPLLNPIWVFLAVGEHPSVFGLAGMVLILTGVLLDTALRIWLPHLRTPLPGTGGPPP